MTPHRALVPWLTRAGKPTVISLSLEARISLISGDGDRFSV